MADHLAFPWALDLSADQLGEFINDLWGAAAAEDDLEALTAVEKVIAQYSPAGAQASGPLSERDLAVLTGLAYGATYAALGERLGIAATTIESIVLAVCRQLEVQCLSDALEFAGRRGWIPELPVPASIGRRVGRGYNAWRRNLRDRVAEMRAAPGEAVPLGPYSSYSGAWNAARRITKGLWPEVQPAGAFSAQVVVSEPNQWVVETRYIGDPTSTKEQP
ncbi:hypothetical protein [Streptomyces sp. NPDC001914]|uniref:hypothetical protein n=1 Tax=Streptomyces sp. NPDC001914 TaxID=3364623 RepID=UPI0036A7DE05